jgi:mercuric ion transport protein
MSAAGAVLGASCCVLPLVLANLGIGSALFGSLGFFVSARPWLLGAAVALIALAAAVAFRSGRRPSAWTAAVLGVAVLFVAASLALPHVEGRLLEMFAR